MTKLYTDASFDWTHTEKTTENVVRGKIAITDADKFEHVDKVAIGKVPELKQYINVFELTAIARAVELAIENNFEGILSIWSDSQVAVGWAKKGEINPNVKTEAHRSALEYLVAQTKAYRNKNMAYGEIQFNFIPREKNPAGYLLQNELDNGNKPYDL
jgi:hypothetical protein